MPMEPHVLDVRPILASGGQPMQAILSALNQLAAGQALRLIAPFRPEPLFKVMEKKGYAAHPVDQPNGDCEVLFTPLDAPDAGDAEGAPSAPSPLSWPDPERHLDLTDLDPPEPMARILGELEDMTEGSVLFSLLTREPVFLYSELTRRGHTWVGNFDSSGETYRILIRRGGSHVA